MEANECVFKLRLLSKMLLCDDWKKNAKGMDSFLERNLLIILTIFECSGGNNTKTHFNKTSGDEELC